MSSNNNRTFGLTRCPMFGWFKKRDEPVTGRGKGVQKKRHDIQGSEMAQVLLDELVQKIHVRPPSDLHLDEGATARYEAKARLYQLSVVFMALVNEERTNPNFRLVRENLESYTRPSSTEDRANLRAEVRK